MFVVFVFFMSRTRNNGKDGFKIFDAADDDDRSAKALEKLFFLTVTHEWYDPCINYSHFPLH